MTESAPAAARSIRSSTVSRTPGAAKKASYHEQGREIYNFRCYFCHGYSGDAKTLAASFLKPKPRSFVDTAPDKLSRQQMIRSVSEGRPGTAMKSFANTLTAEEIETVVDFVRQEFMLQKAINTRYHTAENGWPDHQRYAAAFPFALGKIAIDTADAKLTPAQRAGKQMFMASCVTCHDRGKVKDEGLIWDPRAVSFPRNQVTPQVLSKQLAERATSTENVDMRDQERDMLSANKNPRNTDSVSSATPYSVHEKAPVLHALNNQEKQGEALFQQNCAFCHAADGTGKNWIGSFLEPHPRNLTDSEFMSSMTQERLRNVIHEGLPGTTMSAWKNVLNDEEIDSIIAYIERAFHRLPEPAPAEH